MNTLQNFLTFYARAHINFISLLESWDISIFSYFQDESSCESVFVTKYLSDIEKLIMYSCRRRTEIHKFEIF